LTPVTPGELPVRASFKVGLLALVVAGLVIFPGLLATGLWTHLELEAYDQTEAWLGEPVRGVVRSPWLPIWLRAQARLVFESAEAIRIPGAVASCVTVALAAMLARLRGWSSKQAFLVAGFALSFPILGATGRLAAGTAIGETFAGIGIFLAWIGWQSSGIQRWFCAVVATLAIATASLSMGIVLGGVLPLAAVAWMAPKTHKKAQIGLMTLAAALAAGAGYLCFHQGDGYIPVLGAAKDARLLELPTSRNGTSPLTEFGYQFFPWLPLMIVGLMFPGRDRWPAQWLVLGIAIASGWALVYGRIALPLVIPAAMVCAAGFRVLFASRSLTARRLGLATAVGGMLILAKDGARTPSLIGDPLGHHGERLYPAQPLGAGERLAGLSKLGILGLGAIWFFARRRREQTESAETSRLDRLRDRLEWLPWTIAAGILGHQAMGVHQQLIAGMGTHASARQPLEAHASWARAGELPATLGTSMVDDPSIALYGPEQLHKLHGRLGTHKWLAGPGPAVALIRRGDLPQLVQQHRAEGWPLFVLDSSHFQLSLVSNRLPTGAREHNPLATIVVDEPPALAHTTHVRFEDAVEVIGWEIEGPIIRGRPFTIVIALRALDKLPVQTAIYARLQKGRLSRINYLPVPVTDKQYPPNLWRAGDIVVHRQTVVTPTLEIVSGNHDLVIALQPTKTRNFRISEPTERETEGVTILDSGRHFASVGQVMVW